LSVRSLTPTSGRTSRAMFRASIVEAAARRSCQKAVGASHGGNLRTHRWTPVVKDAVRRRFGLGWPRGLLKQQTGTGRPEGPRLQQSLKQKPGCGRSLGRPWRRTFSWPQGSSGKPSGNSGRESRAWLRLCSVGEEKNSLPQRKGNRKLKNKFFIFTFLYQLQKTSSPHVLH